LLDYLGESVSSEIVALFELVKNAYDADAIFFSANRLFVPPTLIVRTRTIINAIPIVIIPGLIICTEPQCICDT
jgi:hypothetical protein